MSLFCCWLIRQAALEVLGEYEKLLFSYFLLILMLHLQNGWHFNIVDLIVFWLFRQRETVKFEVSAFKSLRDSVILRVFKGFHLKIVTLDSKMALVSMQKFEKFVGKSKVNFGIYIFSFFQCLSPEIKICWLDPKTWTFLKIFLVDF